MTTRQLATGMILLAGITMTIIAGCGSDWQNCKEKFISEGIAGSASAPAWVQGKIPNGRAEEAYFVGRSIGYNVLDERAAYRSAENDAMEQMAQYLDTWVSSRQRESDCRMFKGGEKPLSISSPGARANEGPRFLPGEKGKNTLGSCAKLTTEALTGDLVVRDVYWERWQISEEPADETLGSNLCSRTMNRYKCWVLVSIDKTKLESRLAATTSALKAASPCKMYHVEGTEAKEERFDARGVGVLYRLSMRK